MIPVFVGILSGLFIILLIAVLKHLDKTIIYGLALSSIGFLYVGFVWTDMQVLVVSTIQAIVFLFIAYFGVKKNTYILAAGYFLHGCWDLAYDLFKTRELIPPHYEPWCMSLDFTICVYILVFIKQFPVSKSIK